MLGPSVICGVMAADREDDPALRRGTRQQEAHVGSVVITAVKDPSTLRALCCAKYVECPVWQAGKRRDATLRTQPLSLEA